MWKSNGNVQAPKTWIDNITPCGDGVASPDPQDPGNSRLERSQDGLASEFTTRKLQAVAR